MNLFRKYLIILTLFSIAMGYLESAVVVYLREIYYPFGFSFPMVTMSGRLALTEILREAATVIMLVSVAWLAGKNSYEKFSWFIFCFAVWDIFYYVFLKLLLNWPESLFTWDILFLIPMVWTGPVIAPVIVSLTMIAFSLLLLSDRISPAFIKLRWLMVLGVFIIFLSLIWDFAGFMLDQYALRKMFNPRIYQIALSHYIPYGFNWWIFIAGELMVLTGMSFSYINSKKYTNVA
jgi:hypothetical protein